MKTIVFLFLVIFFSLNSQAQITEYFCKKLPASSYNSAGSIAQSCSKIIPAHALATRFKNDITSFEHVEITPKGEGYTVLGSNDLAYYLKTTKDNKIIGLQQGYDGKSSVAPFCYNYEIKEEKGLHFCNAKYPTNSVECQKKWASDPIRNRKDKSCDIFLNAMLACSKDSDSTTKCINNIYAKLNSEDKPKANPNNKPLPGSEGGLADSSDEGDFAGEPDMGSKPAVKINNSKGSK